MTPADSSTPIIDVAGWKKLGTMNSKLMLEVLTGLLKEPLPDLATLRTFAESKAIRAVIPLSEAKGNSATWGVPLSQLVSIAKASHPPEVISQYDAVSVQIFSALGDQQELLATLLNNAVCADLEGSVSTLLAAGASPFHFGRPESELGRPSFATTPLGHAAEVATHLLPVLLQGRRLTEVPLGRKMADAGHLSHGAIIQTFDQDLLDLFTRGVRSRSPDKQKTTGGIKSPSPYFRGLEAAFDTSAPVVRSRCKDLATNMHTLPGNAKSLGSQTAMVLLALHADWDPSDAPLAQLQDGLVDALVNTITWKYIDLDHFERVAKMLADHRSLLDRPDRGEEFKTAPDSPVEFYDFTPLGKVVLAKSVPHMQAMLASGWDINAHDGQVFRMADRIMAKYQDKPNRSLSPMGTYISSIRARQVMSGRRPGPQITPL